MLSDVFKECNRVLKPEKYLTLTFHSNNKKIWNNILNSTIQNGFNLEKIVYQPPLRPSATSLAQPFGSAVGDYFITFVKSPIQKNNDSQTFNEVEYERYVVESAIRILKKANIPLMSQDILNEIIVDLYNQKAFFLSETNIETVMTKHIDKEFKLIPVIVDDEIIGYKWWLKWM